MSKYTCPDCGVKHNEEHHPPYCGNCIAEVWFAWATAQPWPVECDRCNDLKRKYPRLGDDARWSQHFLFHAPKPTPDSDETRQRRLDVVADLIREHNRQNQPYINTAMAIDEVYAAAVQAERQAVLTDLQKKCRDMFLPADEDGNRESVIAITIDDARALLEGGKEKHG